MAKGFRGRQPHHMQTNRVTAAMHPAIMEIHQPKKEKKINLQLAY
jgi:hypothetical protein